MLQKNIEKLLLELLRVRLVINYLVTFVKSIKLLLLASGYKFENNFPCICQPCTMEVFNCCFSESKSILFLINIITFEFVGG